MESILGEMIICPLYFRPSHALLFPTPSFPLRHAYPVRHGSLVAHAKKKMKKENGSPIKPILKHSTAIEERELEEDGGGGGAYEAVGAESENEDAEDFDDEILVDDNDTFQDALEVDDTDDRVLYAGDGGEGGGISLAGTWWDKTAFDIAVEVSTTFDGDLKIYAFKTTVNSIVRVRIEKLSSRYGSPSMTDIEAFSSAYRERLDEAEHAGAIPENLLLEVSSPGVERVVQIPEELDRFKDKPMKVRYRIENNSTASPQENEGLFRLVSFDMDSCHCTWGIADVKANRQKAGKGRPLSKKQREWRLRTPFDSLILVRLHSDC